MDTGGASFYRLPLARLGCRLQSFQFLLEMLQHACRGRGIIGVLAQLVEAIDYAMQPFNTYFQWF